MITINLLVSGVCLIALLAAGGLGYRSGHHLAVRSHRSVGGAFDGGLNETERDLLSRIHIGLIIVSLAVALLVGVLGRELSGFVASLVVVFAPLAWRAARVYGFNRSRVKSAKLPIRWHVT